MKFFAVFAAVLAISAAAPTTQWTLNELTNAIENPVTPNALLPYLEHALNTIMEALFTGKPVESVVVMTPAGPLPHEAVASPAAVMPVIIAEPVAPVAVVEPTPAAVIADAAGSPLVQIVVNIKSAETAAAPEAPATVIEPTPVDAPMPIIVVEEAAQPEPINVVDQVVQPEPVVIAPSPIVIAPAPAPVVVPEANPIDIIAVGTPEVNPIDLLQPVPVVVGAGDSQGILV